MSELSREFGLGLEMELIWRENQEIQKSKMIVEIVSKIKNPSSNPLLCASSSAKLLNNYLESPVIKNIKHTKNQSTYVTSQK